MFNIKTRVMLNMLTEHNSIKRKFTQVVFSMSPLQKSQHSPLTNCSNIFLRIQLRECSRDLHLHDITAVQVSHQLSLAATSLKFGSIPSVARSSLDTDSVVTIPYFYFRSNKLYMFRIEQSTGSKHISARVN